MPNQAPTPPYTPGFGRRPPVVAGRDALVDDEARVLEVGPEHPRFCRALLGSRGTGKTVLLDVIGEVASKKLGWAVLHVQALQEESLVGVLLQRMPEALQPWGRLGRGTRDLQAALSVGVNLGVVSAGATVERRRNAGVVSPAAAFEDALGRVGAFAAAHGTGLLLTVDEAQAAPEEDLSALARALQTVVARRLQPVAVVFSGLPTFRERLAGAGTYASRLPVEEVGSLDATAARLALVGPAARRHVAWEDEALGLLVRRSAGHPYYLQLFGWHAWEAAQGEATITLAHARAGLASARAELAGQYETTWARLRPQERDYLAAVAALASAGSAGIDEVAKALGKEPKQLAVARDRLVHMHGLLEVPERAKLRFTDAEMADWAARRPDGARVAGSEEREGLPPAPARSAGQAPRKGAPSKEMEAARRRRASAERPRGSGR
jgi:AAA ATPase domain